LARCIGNLETALRLARGVPAVSIVIPGGGWSVVMRYPRIVSEEALVLELLEKHGVAVHPGFFFDFPVEGYVVASLLPTHEVFESGFGRVLDAIAAKL
jgi:aspartate/methionine/tyrosine aminotransferase